MRKLLALSSSILSPPQTISSHILRHHTNFWQGAAATPSAHSEEPMSPSVTMICCLPC